MITSWLEICSEISKETGIPFEEVREEVLAYTKDVKENASKMVNLEIYLFGIGVFKMRRIKLREFINKVKRRIEILKNKVQTIRVINGTKENESWLEHMESLHDKMNKLYKQKKSNFRSELRSDLRK